MTGRRIVLALAAVLLMAPIATPGSAQDYPSRPVRIVVPFGAGGPADVTARQIGNMLQESFGQPFVVENRTGAGGVIGTVEAAKSPPDGYTLLQANIASNAIAVSLYAKMPYDQLRDFAPITRIGLTPNIILVHPSVPFRTVRQMVDYARANPGKLNYSAALAGTSPHLTMELLKLQLKFDVVHIPYKIGTQAVTDTIAGQVPINISNAPLSIGALESRRLRALAVTSAQRLSVLPDVPTMQESGVPNFEVNSWYGLMAPAGTPAAVLDKINADMHTALRSPEVEKRMLDLAMPPSPTTRQEFDKFVRGEVARWARVIKEAGIPQQ
jgi:tripartite-type tricarboxylate transporter receptor subunit TctC